MFTSLHIQGNLISEELLQQVAEGTAPGQQATDFHLEPGTRLSNEIEYAWSRIRLEWKRFADKREALPATDPYGTTLARRWMEDFFKALGFDLDRPGQALEGGNGQRYSISHTSESPKGLPVHIVGFIHPDTTAGKEVNTLDVRSSGGTSRLSPHSTVQEYLNVTNHLYGLVTNGLQLRLLRDSGRLVKFTYIEFDLRRMLEQDQYADFTLLYRLLHCSRFGGTDDADDCWLEEYYKQSIETGNRIRDGLSKAVKEALTALGNGFVSHPDNEALRQALSNGTLSAKAYYRELLRLVYRLLFLLVTEERDLVYDPEDKSDKTTRYRQLYQRYYSLARLRRLSEHRYLYNENYTDLWPALQATFRLFEADGNGQKIGIQPLGGDLFSATAMPHIINCTLANRLLLECLRNMNEFTDPVSRSLVTINYKALDVEELGSVYEGLLDLHPVVQPATYTGDWSFTFHEGTDRKTTGSYYTRPDLVNELIKSALIPVIEERLKANAGNREAQVKALLALKVCDPAAGSGHMLLAGARTIAWYLARVQSGDENPGPSIYRICLRKVIQHCIYAVDYNPDAVELCKLALWLEGHNSGKPLSFLDHKIRNGNSLVGITDLSVLEKPIPDEAFNQVTGDDKNVCKELKRHNADFRRTRQGDLFSIQGQQIEKDKNELKVGYREIESISQDTLEAVQEVKYRFEKVRRSIFHEEKACHLWTTAFFKTYLDADDPTNPSSEKMVQYFNSPTQYGRLIGEATRLAEELKYFHWPLEFPDVFDQGGFDVIISNPPWEKIKLQQTEFFSSRDAQIANAANKSERDKLIKDLPETNPALYMEYSKQVHFSECQSKFLRGSGRYELTAIGDINTYAVFAELLYSLINKDGRMSAILPTGIATDENTSLFFRTLVERKQIDSFWGYKNEKFLFAKPVEHTVTFGILNISAKPLFEKNYIDFCWLAYTVEEANDENRRIKLTGTDLLRLNPNTQTSPICRTKQDLDLLQNIYTKNPILERESGSNQWSISFQRMYDMASDSGSFRVKKALQRDGYELHGNKFVLDDQSCYLPLYESKMIREFDHRFGSYESFDSRSNSMLPTPSQETYKESSYISVPWYWVNREETVLRASFVPEELKKAYRKGEQEVKKAVFIWLYSWYRDQGDNTNLEKCLTSLNKLGFKKRKPEIELLSIRMNEGFPLKVEDVQLLEGFLEGDGMDLVRNLLLKKCPKWLLGFRNVARSTDERTAIFGIIPFAGVGHSMPLLYVKNANVTTSLILVANFFSIVFDWVVRQKVAGVNFSYFYIKQLPIIDRTKVHNAHKLLIIPTVLELTYTAWDIKPFADDLWNDADDNLKLALRRQWKGNAVSTGGHSWTPPEWCADYGLSQDETTGCPLSPFKWDEERRAMLKAELDAIYAKLYGLNTEELRYILDPQDVYGPDFPGETFRVLKEKEIKQFGEYRTRRLVLEAWERLHKNEKLPDQQMATL